MSAHFHVDFVKVNGRVEVKPIEVPRPYPKPKRARVIELDVQLADPAFIESIVAAYREPTLGDLERGD